MSLNPEATSTPNHVPHVKPRKPIRNTDGYSNSIQSPIPQDNKSGLQLRACELSNTSPKSNRRGLSLKTSRSYDNLSDQEYESDIEHKGDYQDANDNQDKGNCQDTNDNQYKNYPRTNDNQNKSTNPQLIDSCNDNFLTAKILICGISFIVIICSISFFPDYFVKKPTELKVVHNSQKQFFQQQDFFQQDLDFFFNFEVNLKDVINFGKTKTIILLYDNETETVVDRIINKIAPTILCLIRDCSRTSVLIEGGSLNEPKYIDDYGRILSDYKDSLEENGLLIVRNLEEISGKSIQAFHYICDEYNPFVNKAFIILTMKMEKTPYKDQKSFLRNALLKLWNDIGKDNIFDPLISRITGTILSVK